MRLCTADEREAFETDVRGVLDPNISVVEGFRGQPYERPEVLKEGANRRRFRLPRRGAPEGSQVLNVRVDCHRPVSEAPFDADFQCRVVAHADAMVAAEGHAREWADAHGLNPHFVVWTRSHWTEVGPRRLKLPVSIAADGPEDLTALGKWLWTVREQGGALWELMKTGMGPVAITEDVIHLFIPDGRRAPLFVADSPRCRHEMSQRLVRAAGAVDLVGVRRALACGADVRSVGNRAILAVVCAPPNPSCVEVLKTLLEAGAKPDGWQPVLAHHGRRQSFEDLVAAGLSLEEWGTDQRSPLTCMVISGRVEELQALIRAGADPNRPDGSGWTPLHYAHRHRPMMVDALLDAGADPERLSFSGRKPGEDVDRPIRATRRDPMPSHLLGGVQSEVLADWLLENGDPRGEALARRDEARLKALAGQVMLGRFPALEEAWRLGRIRTRWGFVCGVYSTDVEEARRFALLLRDYEGSLCDTASLHAFDDLGPVGPSIRTVRLTLEESAHVPQWRTLDHLVLRGQGVVGLDVVGHFSQLEVRQPRIRDLDASPLRGLRAPNLKSLLLEFASVPGLQSRETLFEGMRDVRLSSLSVHPTSVELFCDLVEQPWFSGLRQLTLRGCWPDIVPAIHARAHLLSDIDLTVRLLDVDKEARRALQEDFDATGLQIRVTGEDYRGRSGFGS